MIEHSNLQYISPSYLDSKISTQQVNQIFEFSIGVLPQPYHQPIHTSTQRVTMISLRFHDFLQLFFETLTEILRNFYLNHNTERLVGGDQF